MWNFNSSRDGQNAWLALLNHHEGEAQKDRVKDNAYAAIAAARYHGERRSLALRPMLLSIKGHMKILNSMESTFPKKSGSGTC